MHRILLPFIFSIITAFQPCFAGPILSNQSGEWNNPATWKSGMVPGGDDIVIIEVGTDITISSNGGNYTAICKSLTINGSLTYYNNRAVIGSPDPLGNPSSGGNSEMTVNGTLTIGGGYQNSFFLNGNLTFNPGSVFNMTSGFMHVNGNTGTPLSSVAAGKALVDFTNATTFMATGGTLYITNPHIDAATTCIKGQKNFSGDASVSFGGYIAPITNNNFFVDAATAPSFQSIELNFVSNSVKLQMTDIDIKGAININNGTFYNPDLIKTVRIGKDINIGSNGKIEGRIELNGPSQQNINPNTENGIPVSSAVFSGDVISNNVSRVKIKLDIEILGDLILTRGRFDLNHNTLTLKRSPMTPSNTAYIVTHDLYQEVGTLKIKNVTTNTIFPVGTEQSYSPVFITALGGDFSVSAHPSTITVPSQFSRVNLEWDITRVSGNFDADILVQWNNSDEANSFTPNRNQCKLYHYNGSIWEPMSPSSGPTTSWGTYFTKLAEEVQSFSTFSIFAPSVVPVTLTYFKGQVQNNDAHLAWETATEFNNAGFDVEKSTDGLHFSSIGFVKGNGSSFTQNTYSFIDKNFTKTAYYRLNQFDFDGKTTYSSIVSLQKEGKGNTVKIYPNPISTQSDLTIEFSEQVETSLNIDVVDVQGRILYKKQSEKGIESLKIPVGNWARGMYFVRLTNGAKTEISKFIKN